MTNKKNDGKTAGTIRIEMVRSVIGCTIDQRESIRGLGLRRIRQVVERADTKSTRGLINRVPHLVRVVG
jgi:large subunit ribosomal protein L30